jgi:ABC-type enterobactin transport system permease subunit
VAGNEPVTSPDQHKPTNVKLARIGGIITIAILLLMTIGNHQGKVEDLWLVGIALVLALLMLADWLLRKNGLNAD